LPTIRLRYESQARCDGAAKPGGRLFVSGEMQLRGAGAAHPVMGGNIAGAEVQRLAIVALGLQHRPRFRTGSRRSRRGTQRDGPSDGGRRSHDRPIADEGHPRRPDPADSPRAKRRNLGRPQSGDPVARPRRNWGRRIDYGDRRTDAWRRYRVASWENTGWLSTICERWIWSQPRGAFCERATFYNTVNRGTEAIAEFEHALMLDRNLVYTHALIGMAGRGPCSRSRSFLILRGAWSPLAGS
jgi:hypothetical protein